MHSVILPRKVAVQREMPRYFTGLLCKNGHVSNRITKTSACTECERERCRKYNRENSSVRKKYNNENKAALDEWKKTWSYENREKINAQKREAYQRDRDAALARRKRYYYENRSNQLLKNKEWRTANTKHLKEYQQENVAQYAFRTSLRRSARINATPAWLNEDERLQIAAMYRQSRSLSISTSTPHQVDHIVPLKGHRVCGLHVPWNLRVITAFENLSKGNRLIKEDAT